LISTQGHPQSTYSYRIYLNKLIEDGLPYRF